MTVCAKFHSSNLIADVFALYVFCTQESHAPASCSQLVDWCAKCANESETANWIIANTKKCPACKARIEKNQVNKR